VSIGELRKLPSVDRLLGQESVGELIDSFGRTATVDAVRAALDRARDEVRAGAPAPTANALVEFAADQLRGRLSASLGRVINATGVIIHTNLGRAPLSDAALQATEAVSRGYSTLEYDLDRGMRGQRSVHNEALLCELTGAEAALVVNNNAGAVLLALTGLARGRGVVISRGQLIEIGGGFRIPDVLAQSGARLAEVGTTNRTHLRDYRAALESDSGMALILRAHHSNYRIVGYAGEPGLAELVSLGAEYGVPAIDDLGSGALLDTAAYGLAHEPMVQESVLAGAAAVCFSGDKLLGGPQAGIIVGQAAPIDRMRSHPLARALRADKLCLAALQATLLHYLRDEATACIPVWQMIAASLPEIDRRARGWKRKLAGAGIASEVIDSRSTVGGGSLPGETLPTRAVALSAGGPDRLASALRAGMPPVIARIEDERLVLDPRTVLSHQDRELLGSVTAVYGGGLH
jgi:L-seryl-tRNA(Ser) seleniumtransferase